MTLNKIYKTVDYFGTTKINTYFYLRKIDGDEGIVVPISNQKNSKRVKLDALKEPTIEDLRIINLNDHKSN